MTVIRHPSSVLAEPTVHKNPNQFEILTSFIQCVRLKYKIKILIVG